MTDTEDHTESHPDCPQSVTFSIFTCADGHVHVVGYDENEKPFANISLSPQQAIEIGDVGRGLQKKAGN